MSKKHNASKEEDLDTLHLDRLTVPISISHIKPGNTLCANEYVFVTQNGPTLIELRAPPKFEPRKIPWRDGLLRDIVWCPQLAVFILLTQKTLYTFDPASITAPVHSSMATRDLQLKITAYNKIKPFDDRFSFWRCTAVGTRIFIVYSGK